MGEKQEDKVVYMTGAEFFGNSEECDLTDEFLQKLDERTCSTILDEAQQRRQGDWSLLANQVVGGENIGGKE